MRVEAVHFIPGGPAELGAFEGGRVLGLEPVDREDEPEQMLEVLFSEVPLQHIERCSNGLGRHIWTF